jgi:hypothetical protein
MTSFELISLSVVGVKHRVGNLNALTRLPLGMTVTLEREPHNKHDANAIKVLIPTATHAAHVGYIPQGQAGWIAALLDNGYDITATLVFANAARAELTIELRMCKLT